MTRLSYATSFSRRAPLGVLAFAALFLFAIATPASALTCPDHNPNYSVVCSGGMSWCGETCQAEPTCTAPKLSLSCGTCQCGCPADKPYDCTSSNSECQAGNSSCTTFHRVEICDVNPGSTVRACGNCVSGYTDCSGTCKPSTNPACPPPSVYDACAETCVEPFVRLSPGMLQTAEVKLSGPRPLEVNGDIFLSSNKALRVDAAGATKLSIGNWGTGATAFDFLVSGKIGINTGIPGYPLDISSNSGAAELRINDTLGTLWTGAAMSRSNNEKWFVGMNGSDDALRFRRGGSTDDLIISTVGNVGVGMAPTTDRLSVSGNVTSSTFVTAQGYRGSYANGVPRLLVNTPDTIFQYYDGAVTREAMRYLGTNGNVGIGTTSPSTVLNVIGNSNTVGTIRVTANNVTDAPWIEFGVNGLGGDYATKMGSITNSEGFRFRSMENVSMIPGATSAFKVLNSTATTTYLTVLGSNGNVGIGTASPTRKLELADTVNSVYMKYSPTGPKAWVTGADSYGYIVYDGVYRMVIDQVGNVGIGTVVPNQKLEVNGGLLRVAGAPALAAAYGGYLDLWGGNGGGADAGRIFFGNGSGWKMHFSSRVGGATTDNMTIQDNGNIGIGTTNPAFKLDVAGTANVTSFRMPTGAVDGRIFTSDASGNASWKPLGAVTETDPEVGTLTNGKWCTSNGVAIDCTTDAPAPGLGGSGTLNYVAKFTPTGTSLGNSQIFDNGTNVGIGTAVPESKLHVAGSLLLDNGNYLRIKRSSGGAIISVLGIVGDIMTTLLPNSTVGAEAWTVSNTGGLRVMTVYGDGMIGFGTSAPGYPLDIVNSTVNNTAILRLANNNALKKWTGIRLDRNNLIENWFLGMNETDDAFRIRRTNLGIPTDVLTIDTVGKTTVANLQITGGAPLLGKVWTATDALGNATWQSIVFPAEADTLASVMARNSSTGAQLVSTVVTGTAPFSVASTTVVANLNADLLDGLSSGSFATAAQGTSATTAFGWGNHASANYADTDLTYADPAWITSLASSKISGTVANATNATTVTNGVYTTGTYANPAWITSLASSKITGTLAVANGGTNSSAALINNRVMVSSTNAIVEAAAGTSGQVLTSGGAGAAPAWQNIPAAGIGGSGTANYLPKFTAGTTLGNSRLYDNGTNLGVGTAAPTQAFDVVGSVKLSEDIYLADGKAIRADAFDATSNLYIDNFAGGESDFKLWLGGVTYAESLRASSEAYFGTSSNDDYSQFAFYDWTTSLNRPSVRIHNTNWGFDPTLSFVTNHSTPLSAWTLGVDDSDAGKFKIRTGQDIGVSSVGCAIDVTGKLTCSGSFAIGGTEPFQVNSSGDIVKIKGVIYAWPAAQGAASTVLTNNGTGTLAWQVPAAVAENDPQVGTLGVSKWCMSNALGTILECTTAAPTAASVGAEPAIGVLTVGKGGTGISSYAAGDLIYASGPATLAKLSNGTSDVYMSLKSGGPGLDPRWGYIRLTTDVTGTLPSNSGGTGMNGPTAVGQYLRSDAIGSWAASGIQAGDLPIHAHAGYEPTITTLAVAKGGTGSGTQNFVDLTSTQTAAGNKTWTNQATFNGAMYANNALFIGDAAADTVVVNSNAWTFNNATALTLVSSTAALNFDSNTLVIDSTNNRIGIGDATPLSTFTVGNNDLFRVDGSTGFVGIGTAPISEQVITLNKSWSAAGTFQGIYGNLTTTGALSKLQGVSMIVSDGGGAIDIGEVQGFSVLASATSSVFNNAYGYYAQINQDSPGYSYGLYVTSNVSSGAGNHYGVYIEGSGTGAGTNYGIYQETSTDKNYFAGNVDIGTAATVAALRVVGLIAATGSTTGVSGSGSTAGGYFLDSDGTATAYVATGGYAFYGNIGNGYIAGNLGIGILPSYKLDVSGTANLNSGISSGIALRVNGDEAVWYDGARFSWGFGGTSNYFADNVGIGIAPTYQLQLSTNSAGKPTSSSWTITSDRRLKRNIQPFSDGLEKIREINPISYELNGHAGMPEGEKGISIVAQDMLKVMPYTISTFRAKYNPGDVTDQEFYNFDSSALTFVLVNSIKEIDAELSKAIKFAPDGVAIIPGDLSASENVWGDGTKWITCPTKGKCSCPNGSFVTEIMDQGVAVKCNKI